MGANPGLLATGGTSSSPNPDTLSSNLPQNEVSGASLDGKEIGLGGLLLFESEGEFLPLGEEGYALGAEGF